MEKISKQRKWQIERQKLGECVRCGKDAKGAGLYCAVCKAKRKAWYVKTPRIRRNKCSTCGRTGHNRTTCKETA